MRLALAALLLGLACATLHAQTPERKKAEEKKKAAPFKAESTRTERERDRHREPKPPASAREQRALMPERKQPPNPKAHTVQSPQTETQRDRRPDPSPQSERWRDPPPPASAREQSGLMNQHPKPPANKQFSAHPSETRPPPSAPSVAEQQQRQMEQQRRVEQGKSGGTQQAVFQCNARPVCGGGGYGSCAGVQQTYRGGTEQSRRNDIVNDCIQANTPDTCQCAVQCRRVARCSIF